MNRWNFSVPLTLLLFFHALYFLVKSEKIQVEENLAKEYSFLEEKKEAQRSQRNRLGNSLNYYLFMSQASVRSQASLDFSKFGSKNGFTRIVGNKSSKLLKAANENLKSYDGTWSRAYLRKRHDKSQNTSSDVHDSSFLKKKTVSGLQTQLTKMKADLQKLTYR